MPANGCTPSDQCCCRAAARSRSSSAASATSSSSTRMPRRPAHGARRLQRRCRVRPRRPDRHGGSTARHDSRRDDRAPIGVALAARGESRSRDARSGGIPRCGRPDRQLLLARPRPRRLDVQAGSVGAGRTHRLGRRGHGHRLAGAAGHVDGRRRTWPALPRCCVRCIRSSNQAAIKALLQNSTVNANPSATHDLTRQGVGVVRVDRRPRR